MRSRARGESMLGSGFSEAGILLVEQPGPWGHAGLAASRFDPEVASALQKRAGGAGLRLLAIRRPGRTEPGARRSWGLRTPYTSAVRWETFDADAELLDAPLDGSVGAPDTEASYLVCTHGKRDQCCAVFGKAVANELERRRPARVWECSHTGGHRFAPNVVALPGGALYGRIAPADIPDLIEATDRGEALPRFLRGVIGQPPVVQAAVAFAQQRTGLTRLDAFAAGTANQGQGGSWTVELVASGASYVVTVEKRTVEVDYASCGKPDAKRETEWIPVELTEL